MRYETEEDIRLFERFARNARDFDDFQNEMAGRDTGRMKRFLRDGASTVDPSGKAKQERAEAFTHLQLAIMANPAYAALFKETKQALNTAQSRLDTLLEQVRDQISMSEDALENKLDRAASLPDGTKVFKDKNGDVRTLDGALVAAELAATVIWRGNEPSFEDLQAETERLARLKKLVGDIQAGQAEIGEMQSSMADESEVETSDELEQFKNRANEIVEEAEERLNAEMAREEPVITRTAVENTAELSVPKL